MTYCTPGLEEGGHLIIQANKIYSKALEIEKLNGAVIGVEVLPFDAVPEKFDMNIICENEDEGIVGAIRGGNWKEQRR